MIKNIFLVAFIFLISHSPSYAEAKSGGIYSEDLAYEREKLGGYIKSLQQLIANSNNNTGAFMAKQVRQPGIAPPATANFHDLTAANTAE